MFLLLVIVNPFSFTCLTKITKHYYPFQFFVKIHGIQKILYLCAKMHNGEPHDNFTLKQPRHIKNKPFNNEEKDVHFKGT